MVRRSSYQPLARARTGRPLESAGHSNRLNPRREREMTLVARSAFCVLAGITESQLRLWEHEQLITPVAGARAELLYTPASLRRARIIRTLAEELEVNLAGIDVILNLLDQIAR